MMQTTLRFNDCNTHIRKLLESSAESALCDNDIARRTPNVFFVLVPLDNSTENSLDDFCDREFNPVTSTEEEGLIVASDETSLLEVDRVFERG